MKLGSSLNFTSPGTKPGTKSTLEIHLQFVLFFPFSCTHAQLCPILCDPMDCSPPGFSVHGIFQAKILEWVAISYSSESSWPRDRIFVSGASSSPEPLALAGRSIPHHLGKLHVRMFVCMLNHFSHIRLLATQWTIAHQALLSMGLSRQEP